jgi:hypothetical protein
METLWSYEARVNLFYEDVISSFLYKGHEKNTYSHWRSRSNYLQDIQNQHIIL